MGSRLMTRYATAASSSAYAYEVHRALRSQRGQKLGPQHHDDAAAHAGEQRAGQVDEVEPPPVITSDGWEMASVPSAVSAAASAGRHLTSESGFLKLREQQQKRDSHHVRQQRGHPQQLQRDGRKPCGRAGRSRRVEQRPLGVEPASSKHAPDPSPMRRESQQNRACATAPCAQRWCHPHPPLHHRPPLPRGAQAGGFAAFPARDYTRRHHPFPPRLRERHPQVGEIGRGGENSRSAG